MRGTMLRSLSLLAALTACGGHSPAPRAPGPVEPALEPHAEQTWYRATTICGQGPYEIELPTTGATYGEEVALELHAPHDVALHVEVLENGQSIANQTYGDKPANARCVADVKERLAMAHAAAGPSAPGTPVETGTMVVPPPSPTAPPTLSLEIQPPASSTEVVRVRIPEHTTPTIKIRFWSVEPNDLEGVLFGAAHIVWQPNVPEAQYEAHLRMVAERERAEQERLAAEEARRTAEDARRAAEWARTHPAPPVDQRAEEERRRRDEEQRRRDEEQRRRADEERRRRAEEDARRRQIEAALEVQRREARARFCAAHADDRDCWGAGGLRVHLELERHQQEADAYCRAHQEDARCWSTDEKQRRLAAWNARLVEKPVCQPTGAPPAALAETQPPALSPHATWRPGYYQWTECTWVWLAGQWRVPDSDLVAGTTTSAPAAPPPLQVETPPPPPVKVAVWVPGFWQWSGTTWVWIPGAWQLRPSASVEWRPAEWRVSGSMHVLVPGGWIHVR